MIFGIDFIAKNKLNYCASSCVFKLKGQSEWEKDYAKVQSVQLCFPCKQMCVGFMYAPKVELCQA